MVSMPDPGRLSAHVSLDAVSAYDPESSSEGNERVINLALQRLDDVDEAVIATYDEDTDLVEIDASHLVAGAIRLTYWLAVNLAEERGADVLDVLAEAREYLDS
jgi:hypothetical protein